MTKLALVSESETPIGTLHEVLKSDEVIDADCVMVLVLCKDGSQRLVASRASMVDKMFLIQFAQAWALRWFHE